MPIYIVTSNKLRGKYTYNSLKDARKRAYKMLSEHPRTDGFVYIEQPLSRKPVGHYSWTRMHCGKRYVTLDPLMGEKRILRADGTLGIRIHRQNVYEGKRFIGYRFYGDEEPKSGVVVDSAGKIVRRN